MIDEHDAREQARQAVRRALPDRIGPAGLEAVQRKAQRVLDARLALTPRESRAAVACARGCSMCCHLRVMATPAEVFTVLDYARRQLDRPAFDALAGLVARTAAVVRQLPAQQLLSTNIACPLLVDGACSVYPARPFNCRAYHSLDYDACLTSFRNPADTSLTHPQSAAQARVHEGVQQAFLDASRQAAVDSAQYELVTALDEAMRDPQAEQRFLRGEPVFLHAVQL